MSSKTPSQLKAEYKELQEKYSELQAENEQLKNNISSQELIIEQLEIKIESKNDSLKSIGNTYTSTIDNLEFKISILENKLKAEGSLHETTKSLLNAKYPIERIDAELRAEHNKLKAEHNLLKASIGNNTNSQELIIEQKRNERGAGAKAKYTDEVKETVYKLNTERKLSMNKIAKELGISKGTVFNILKSYNN
jgi:chromosome segregation ATPase